MYDDGIDEPVVLVTDYNKDGQLDGLSIVRDRQNSVKLLVNEKQEIVQEVSYSAYGETQILNRGQKNPVLNNIFYYTSRELEPELGIYYYRARYYDPGTGRFLSEDPIRYKGGNFNLYQYVRNRPTLKRDPFGLQAMGNANTCQKDALERYWDDMNSGKKPDICEKELRVQEYKCLIQSLNEYTGHLTEFEARLIERIENTESTGMTPAGNADYTDWNVE